MPAERSLRMEGGLAVETDTARAREIAGVTISVGVSPPRLGGELPPDSAILPSQLAIQAKNKYSRRELISHGATS